MWHEQKHYELTPLVVNPQPIAVEPPSDDIYEAIDEGDSKGGGEKAPTPPPGPSPSLGRAAAPLDRAEMSTPAAQTPQVDGRPAFNYGAAPPQSTTPVPASTATNTYGSLADAADDQANLYGSALDGDINRAASRPKAAAGNVYGSVRHQQGRPAGTGQADNTYGSLQGKSAAAENEYGSLADDSTPVMAANVYGSLADGDEPTASPASLPHRATDTSPPWSAQRTLLPEQNEYGSLVGQDEEAAPTPLPPLGGDEVYGNADVVAAQASGAPAAPPSAPSVVVDADLEMYDNSDAAADSKAAPSHSAGPVAVNALQGEMYGNAEVIAADDRHRVTSVSAVGEAYEDMSLTAERVIPSSVVVRGRAYENTQLPMKPSASQSYEHMAPNFGGPSVIYGEPTSHPELENYEDMSGVTFPKVGGGWPCGPHLSRVCFLLYF